MADRVLKLRRLQQILRMFGVEWNPRRGKGSHGTFEKLMGGGVFTYPVPNESDVLSCYVRGARKKF
jgi:hypothetical protein